MRAIVYYNYGAPDVLRLKEIERPTAANSDVLIKVRAASVNPLDCGELKGVPFIFRMLFGLRNQQLPGLGGRASMLPALLKPLDRK